MPPALRVHPEPRHRLAVNLAEPGRGRERTGRRAGAARARRTPRAASLRTPRPGGPMGAHGSPARLGGTAAAASSSSSSGSSGGGAGGVGTARSRLRRGMARRPRPAPGGMRQLVLERLWSRQRGAASPRSGRPYSSISPAGLGLLGAKKPHVASGATFAPLAKAGPF